MENSKAKFKFTLLFSILFDFFLVILSPSTNAVVLYLEPDSGQHNRGDTFIEEVRIDTEGECINAIEANFNFSNDILEAVDFSQGESILTLWVKTPTINQGSGQISFIGGIPGEYCGEIPGDPGPTNLLGKIILKASEPLIQTPEENLAEINFLDSSQVFLSDRLGTKAKLTTRGATFKISAQKSEVPENQWQKEIEKDIIPPESFKIEIHQDVSIFERKYFIIFSTTDKQTGIDYYEIKEGEGEWKVSLSPSLLEDQNLESIIKVRAVDKAGNERVAEYLPPLKPKPFPYPIMILVLIGLIWIIWWIIRKRK